ncbi:membrane protein [Streptomyces sp. NRRL WC-3618]|nr:membrane protein [Streptomyces sp. NRRL WC-3618]
MPNPRKRTVTRPAGPPIFEAPERPAGREFIDPRHDGEPNYPAIQQSEEFSRLRRRLRLFVFPMSALFFCWYMTFVLLSAYAHEFMSRKVTGEINMGTILGLMQFASTITIVLTYRRFARKKLDPAVDRIHELAGVDRE